MTPNDINLRLDAVTKALRTLPSGHHAAAPGPRTLAQAAIFALDAYDREHPPPALRDALAELGRQQRIHAAYTATTCECGHDRTSHTPLDFGDCSECPDGTCGKYPGILWDLWHRDTLRERDALAGEVSALASLVEGKQALIDALRSDLDRLGEVDDALATNGPRALVTDHGDRCTLHLHPEDAVVFMVSRHVAEAMVSDINHRRRVDAALERARTVWQAHLDLTPPALRCECVGCQMGREMDKEVPE